MQIMHCNTVRSIVKLVVQGAQSHLFTRSTPCMMKRHVLCGVQIPADKMINRNARGIMKKYGMGKILAAFGHQPPTTLVLNNYPDFLTKLEVEGG